MNDALERLDEEDEEEKEGEGANEIKDDAYWYNARVEDA